MNARLALGWSLLVAWRWRPSAPSADARGSWTFGSGHGRVDFRHHPRGSDARVGQRGQDYILSHGLQSPCWTTMTAADAYLVNSSTFAALRGQAGLRRPRSSQQPGQDLHRRDAGRCERQVGSGRVRGRFDNDGWDLTTSRTSAQTASTATRDRGPSPMAGLRVAVGGWSGVRLRNYDGDGRRTCSSPATSLDPSGAAVPGGLPSRGGSKPARPSRRLEHHGRRYRAGAAYCSTAVSPSCGPRGSKALPTISSTTTATVPTEVSAQARVAGERPLRLRRGVPRLRRDAGSICSWPTIPAQLPTATRATAPQDVSYLGRGLNELGSAGPHGVAVGATTTTAAPPAHHELRRRLNVLYHNDGAGLFTDVTFSAGVGHLSIPFLGWGPFHDYDNDGWLDVFVAATCTDRGRLRLEYLVPPAGLLFRRQGSSWRSGAGGEATTARCLRGSAAGDFDNDGDVDLWRPRSTMPPPSCATMGNRAELADPASSGSAARCPRDAIGSVVFCTANGCSSRARWRAAGPGVNPTSRCASGSVRPRGSIASRCAGPTGPRCHEIYAVDTELVIDQALRYLLAPLSADASGARCPPRRLRIEMGTSA